jgi:hypothetical protein
MNNYFDQAFITTAVVKNPSHDRRKKYGPEALDKLPAGTVLFSLNAMRQYEGADVTDRSYYNASGTSVAGPQTKFAKEITKNVKDFEPTAWQHLLIFKYGAITKTQLVDLVTELVDTNAITIGQLLRAAAVIDARLDEPTEPQEASPGAANPPAY